MSTEQGQQLFLVCGTARERDIIARERGISPRDIRLVSHPRDIMGHPGGGRLIIGYTGSDRDFGDIMAYARTHGIEVP